MATHSSILVWKNRILDRGARRATVHGVARVGHDLASKPPPAASVLLCKAEGVRADRLSLYVLRERRHIAVTARVLIYRRPGPHPALAELGGSDPDLATFLLGGLGQRTSALCKMRITKHEDGG